MRLCKRIKIEISEQDAATLEWMQGKCRGLYNWWVMCLRAGKRWPGTNAAKKTLKESRAYDPELDWVYGKAAPRGLIPPGWLHAGLFLTGQEPHSSTPGACSSPKLRRVPVERIAQAGTCTILTSSPSDG